MGFRMYYHQLLTCTYLDTHDALHIWRSYTFWVAYFTRLSVNLSWLQCSIFIHHALWKLLAGWCPSHSAVARLLCCFLGFLAVVAHLKLGQLKSLLTGAGACLPLPSPYHAIQQSDATVLTVSIRSIGKKSDVISRYPGLAMESCSARRISYTHAM